jgi:GNAT superfamily N-acetyltransferase
MSITVRPPTVFDAQALAALTAELGYAARPEEMRARLAALPSSHFVAVAEMNGRVAGWVQAEHRVNLETGDKAELVGLVVAAAARRAGVGSALVRAAEQWAAKRGLRTIVVRSNAARAESHDFYERIGYARTKSQHVYSKPLS